MYLVYSCSLCANGTNGLDTSSQGNVVLRVIAGGEGVCSVVQAVYREMDAGGAVTPALILHLYYLNCSVGP
jgi:hypothetical protein